MRQLVITVTFSLRLQGDFRRFYPREALLSGDDPPRSLDTAPASQPPLKIFQRPAPSASGACARHCWPAGHHTGAFEWAAPRAPASQHQRQVRLLVSISPHAPAPPPPSRRSCCCRRYRRRCRRPNKSNRAAPRRRARVAPGPLRGVSEPPRRGRLAWGWLGGAAGAPSGHFGPARAAVVAAAVTAAAARDKRSVASTGIRGGWWDPRVLAAWGRGPRGSRCARSWAGENRDAIPTRGECVRVWGRRGRLRVAAHGLSAVPTAG